MVAATAALDAVYLLKRWTLALKFLVPGTVFLLAFQVIPVVYTVNVAFTNYSTGHILSRSEAIANIQQNSLTEAENGASYSMTLLRDKDHNLVLGLLDEDSGKTFIGTQAGLQPITRDRVKLNIDGAIASVEGYMPLKDSEFATIDQELFGYKVPFGDR